MIAGGGTAGHVLPGLAVAGALVARGHDPASIRFLGSARGLDGTLVPAAGFAVELLPGRGIQRKLTTDNVGAALGLFVAFWRSLFSLLRWRPSAMLVLGGYASVMPAIVAALLRIPVVVTEQNARASATNRLAARWARSCAVPFEGTDLPKAVVTGSPVRAEVLAAAALDPQARRLARADLGADDGVPFVLAFAGSLGSRRINEAVGGLIGRWAERDVLVYHVVGARDFDAGLVPQAPDGRLRYRAVRYADDLPMLMACADVAVCRAGGGVAELAVMGLPSVLVPLPGAPADHQRANAAVFAEVGAAVVVDDGEMDGDRLAAELDALLGGDALEPMAAAARSLARPRAADDIATLLESAAST